MTAAPFNHRRQDKLRQAQRRKEINLHDPAVNLKGRVERETSLADAGVVDQEIDAAFPVQRFFDSPRQSGVVCRFKGKNKRLAACVIRNLLKRVGAASGKNDARAARDKSLGERLADA